MLGVVHLSERSDDAVEQTVLDAKSKQNKNISNQKQGRSSFASTSTASSTVDSTASSDHFSWITSAACSVCNIFVYILETADACHTSTGDLVLPFENIGIRRCEVPKPLAVLGHFYVLAFKRYRSLSARWFSLRTSCTPLNTGAVGPQPAGQVPI